jgi:hypothetical protein
LVELCDNSKDALATRVRIFTLPGAAHEPENHRLLIV